MTLTLLTEEKACSLCMGSACLSKMSLHTIESKRGPLTQHYGCGTPPPLSIMPGHSGLLMAVMFQLHVSTVTDEPLETSQVLCVVEVVTPHTDPMCAGASEGQEP